MITATNLTKQFGTKTAVSNLTFEVEAGEVLGFLGPNAAGKTTTMRMLTCYFPPSSGKASVAGHDVQTASEQVRRNIGYLPEHVPLYPEMTTREFVEFAAAAKGVPHVDRKKSVEDALGRCNLGKVEHQLVGTLSRGYRQRVGLAQAIVNRPKVLILDEPTVGLDPEQIRDIRSLIKHLAENATVLLSTHILPEVEAACSRVIILAGGQIRAMDTPQNLTSSIEGGMRIRLQLKDAPEAEVMEVLQKISGVSAVRSEAAGVFRLEADQSNDPRAAVSRAMVEKNWDLLELSTQTMKLEDIFLTIVRQDTQAAPAAEPESAGAPAVEEGSDAP